MERRSETFAWIAIAIGVGGAAFEVLQQQPIGWVLLVAFVIVLLAGLYLGDFYNLDVLGGDDDGEPLG